VKTASPPQHFPKGPGSGAAGRPDASQTASMGFQFSTTDFPERDQLVAWREIFGRTVCNLDIDPVNSEHFSAEATIRQFPGLGILVGTTSGVRLSHPKELIVDDDLSFMTGPMRKWNAFQHGRESMLSCGDGVLMNNAEVGGITMPFDTQFITFRVPAAEIAPLVPDIGPLIANPVPANSEALRLLTRYFKALTEAPLPTTPQLQQLVATHVYDLLALALGATYEAAEIAKGRGVRAARVQVILAEIRSRFAEPGFSPADVAAKLDVSSRYIQALLHDTEASFSERIMELRLCKGRAMLAGAVSNVKIIDVAYACGFTDISHFNRCFRRRFGDSPSAFRGQRLGKSDASQ